MANSADPDQLASSEANWSGSTLFAKAGFIRVQQDKVNMGDSFCVFLFGFLHTKSFLKCGLHLKERVSCHRQQILSY